MTDALSPRHSIMLVCMYVWSRQSANIMWYVVHTHTEHNPLNFYCCCCCCCFVASASSCAAANSRSQFHIAYPHSFALLHIGKVSQFKLSWVVVANIFVVVFIIISIIIAVLRMDDRCCCHRCCCFYYYYVCYAFSQVFVVIVAIIWVFVVVVFVIFVVYSRKFTLRFLLLLFLLLLCILVSLRCDFYCYCFYCCYFFVVVVEHARKFSTFFVKHHSCPVFAVAVIVCPLVCN